MHGSCFKYQLATAPTAVASHYGVRSMQKTFGDLCTNYACIDRSGFEVTSKPKCLACQTFFFPQHAAVVGSRGIYVSTEYVILA